MRTSGHVATFPTASTATDPGVGLAGRAAVPELFDLHADGLYRLALAMLRNPDLAQDVVQDTFVRLIAHVDGGGRLPNARGWLYTVAAHACRDRQRRFGRWLPWFSAKDRRVGSESPDAHDGRAAVLHELRALSHRDRLLIALRAHGLSYQEIADSAGVRQTSVGRLLARALDRLARRLERQPEKR